MDKPQLPKMLKKLHLYLLLLSSLIGVGTYAQTFPISVSTQITQPSPIYLSHYADATTINSPIKIQLVLNDLTISSRQVKLKIYFQGNKISFSTNDFVTGARPLYLEGGVPLQLTNVDLAPYFEYQNLLGLTPYQYAQPLPDGAYNIYVEVYDFATGRKLSQKTATSTIIFQNQPPFLNLPSNNASFMQQNIQNIIFSWTPGSVNVSNVEYEFSIVEIWDKYTPVQNAFAYSPPLYTTTTRNTTLQYGVSEPQLLPGKKYAWRIKAKAIFGAEEIGVFKNNGYSEIFSFDYETFCTAPLVITTSGVSENQAKITWSGNIDNYDYEVNYREKNADSEWYKLVTPRENITISNLKPNATYEYTVGASCDVGKYTHSTIKEFTTLVRDEIAFQGCGIQPDPKDLANKNPLPELFPNDVVTAGDFPIVVLHSTGSNGTFTGDGYVTLPFLEKFRKLIDAADALGGEKINIGQFSRIKITFTNIGVNTDFKLISGEIVASYDEGNWDKMLDIDKLADDISEEYDPIMESIFGPKPTQEEVDAAEKEETVEPNNPTPPSETPIEYNPITVVDVDEPLPTPPPIKDTTPVKNETREPSKTTPSNGTVTENGYYIEYKGQKYYNGGRIKIPYRRYMEEIFEMKTLPSDAKVTYSIYEPGQQKMVRGYNGSTPKNSLPIEDNTIAYNLLKQDLQAEATSVEGNPKVRVEIEKVVEKFTQDKLTATHIPNSIKTPKTRIANAGQTLYYVNRPGKTDHRNTEIKAVLSQTDLKKIPKDYIKWKINDVADENKDGTTQIKIRLADDNKVLDSKFTNISGSPEITTKDVYVKWVDENIIKGGFSSSTSNFKVLEEFLKWKSLMAKTTKIIEKIPGIKLLKKNERSSGNISFYADFAVGSTEAKNVEDEDSRLYYRQTEIKTGVEIGLKGTATLMKWNPNPLAYFPGTPSWVTESLKIEIRIDATASSAGEIKYTGIQKKYVETNKSKYSESLNPAIVKFNMDLGVIGEIKAFENNEYFSFGGEASGIAKAEIFRFGYFDGKINSKFFSEGVAMDVLFNGYVNVAGLKYEKGKLYHIQIVEPNTN
ncbi:fibronectin type III domain-containing protein [Flavobacterium sp. DGU38]|uniref:Fibronectin type III domain-containing protein n=1 Tax=Flavobacterium calami TaxID=3139144 RepID=A0ABU9IUW2_9FLAO